MEGTMAKKTWLPSVLVLGWLVVAVPSRALDPWEGATPSDDGPTTRNTMEPGSVQQHDLDQNGTGVNDVDWVVVPTLARHSYEMRLSGSGGGWSWGQCAECGQFERVDPNGTILIQISFYNAAGTLIDTQGAPLAPNAPYVFNTASVSTLVGQSGFARVAHTAGYGGLSGKAVALEPSTGFTFDTVLTPIVQ
jgi:hypothetical protein